MSAFKPGNYFVSDKDDSYSEANGPFYCKTEEDLRKAVEDQGILIAEVTAPVKAFLVSSVFEVSSVLTVKKGKLPKKALNKV